MLIRRLKTFKNLVSEYVLSVVVTLVTSKCNLTDRVPHIQVTTLVLCPWKSAGYKQIKSWHQQSGHLSRCQEDMILCKASRSSKDKGVSENGSQDI